MFKYIYRLLVVLINAKKNYNFPKKNKILIYDSIGSESILLLLKNILDIKPQVMSTRGEIINIPILIINLLKLKFKKKNYIYKYIEIVNPKIIITFIDNNIEFYKINSVFPYMKTVFIQNGWRSYHSDVFQKFSMPDIVKEKFKVDKMLVFGSEIGKEFSKHIEGEYKVIGSLKNNNNIISNTKNKIIIYVSQWMDSNFYIDEKQFNNLSYSYPCDKILIPIIMNFAKKNKYELYILTRSSFLSENEKLEINYFKNTFSKDINFFKKNNFRNSYEIIDTAEIVTGVDSTLLYESIARKNKTAVFSIRGSLLNIKGFNYGWPAKFPNKGNFWTDIPNHSYINSILDFLHTTSFKDINLVYNKNQTQSIIDYDYENCKAIESIKQLLN